MIHLIKKLIVLILRDSNSVNNIYTNMDTIEAYIDSYLVHPFSLDKIAGLFDESAEIILINNSILNRIDRTELLDVYQNKFVNRCVYANIFTKKIEQHENYYSCIIECVQYFPSINNKNKLEAFIVTEDHTYQINGQGKIILLIKKWHNKSIETDQIP